MGGGEADTGCVVIGNVGGTAGDLDKGFFLFLIQQPVKEGSRPLDLIEPHEGVDLGQLDGEIGGIALGEAPSDDELLPRLGPVETAAMSLKDGPDAFLLGRIDEAAGIHQDHIGLVGLGGQFVAVELGVTEHDLGINEILGAAETDQADFLGFRGGMTHQGENLTG